MVGKRLLCVVTLLYNLQNILQNAKVFSSQDVFFVKITKCIYVNQKYMLNKNAKYLELQRDDKPLLVGWPAGRVITDLMLRARLI